ncbi:TonB-dependent receptor [Sphingomonas sp. LB-2]|uniref:TonB-dependent receptor n=1 Tax=Sphingomonas caeni TaxID=2984949 RepID=UPI002230F091|nr:TonB-dependent receptor [Sphingomonas caeni]MCW3847763.1 TonB-dependent receptor [Sphingomonas caeni]
MKRFRLLTACAVPALTMMFAAPAMAQNEQDDSYGNEEIVVTAQGRSQELSKVPLSVTAVSSQTMELTGATDIRQLNQVAPSLLVSSTGSEANGSARIRGVGTVGDNPGLESSVAVFVDGVYRSRSGIGLNEMGDIERIEVLRGPQGTLFGRNASAGIINIVSKAPSFDGFHGGAEATYGNYDYMRFGGFLNLPLGDKAAARIDGVYVKRDGFYNDKTNGGSVNDRDRFFVRGSILFEPTSALSVRLIGDYTKRDENCCAAVYIDRTHNEFIGDLNTPQTPLGNAAGNSIINVLTGLGQPMAAFSDPYSRNIYVTPGRSYGGKTEDWGVSGQIDWDLGGAKLTSITAYRNYFSSQGSDTDYSFVDILYRADDDGSSRQFKTFSQELRLQGEAFGGTLDWLVGAYYANEDLRVTDNLKFGNQYGRFATCRIVSGGALAGLYSPTSPGCLAARPAAFGAASPVIYAAFDTLDAINNKGSTLDVYNQNSRNYAFFTHNIIHMGPQLDLALGLRYTNEDKSFDATFGNNNTGCVANQTALVPFLSNASLAAVSGALIGLSCQGNSTSELNGVHITSERREDKFTGTAVLSFRPTDNFMVYASYSRGYKAGGFNLDRSALKSPILPFGGQAGAQALVNNLQFAPETVDAFEIGAKYSSGPLALNVAIFRQNFSDFQLNTFNGTVFLVQNINGCDTNLNGGDRDQSKFVGAPNYNAAASTTGRCDAADVSYGVRSQGVEIEASIVPARDLRIGVGITYAQTKYNSQLVGSASGAPLDQALRKLPGDNLSNAPELVGTASFAWTPSLGNTGLSGLFYIDARVTDDYNTGSDLFPQKEQDSYGVFNARIGLRGPDQKWSIEFWGQNIFNQDYTQVGFNSPFQEGATSTTTAFADPQYPGGRQLFSAFLAEPRTYGITGRFRF